jgi:hypothetical protein
MAATRQYSREQYDRPQGTRRPFRSSHKRVKRICWRAHTPASVWLLAGTIVMLMLAAFCAAEKRQGEGAVGSDATQKPTEYTTLKFRPISGSTSFK